jgi:type II secretion system protein G
MDLRQLAMSLAVALAPSACTSDAERTQQTARSLVVAGGTLRAALQLFNVDHGRFPSTAEGLGVLAHPPDGTAPYIKGNPRDAWGRDLTYRYPGPAGPGTVSLTSAGADGIDGTPDDQGVELNLR